MEVEFRTTSDDYLAFYQYFYFRRKRGRRIFFVIALSLAATIFMEAGDRHIFIWSTLLIFVVTAVIVFVLSFVLPYIRVVRKIRKMMAIPGQMDPVKIILIADGLTVRREGEAAAVGAWRWESVKYVDSTDRFVFIMLLQWKVFVIPREFFHADDEVGNFIGIIRNGVEKVSGVVRESERAKARKLGYLGLLGIIPNFGAIAGLILMGLGIFRYKSRSLVIIGLADILFTIVFWTAMQHWVFHSPSMTRIERQMSQTQLNGIFKNVEFYKIQHGEYPDSLQQIDDLKNDLWLSDALPSKGSRLKPGHYYYQKTGNKYWLFSVGDDGQPFTADDMYPTMTPADSTKFGLRLR